MRDVLKNTTRKFKIFMADSLIPVAGKTGVTVFAIFLAKDGQAEVAVFPTIVERGHGWYEVSPTAAMRDTVGSSAWTFIAAGALDFPRLEYVIAADALLPAYGATVVADLANLATADQVNALKINTRANLSVPPEIEVPATGSFVIRVLLALFDEIGEMEVPDSTPVVTLANVAGVSRAGRLSVAANPTPGLYTWDYTSSPGDAIEQLIWKFSVTEGGLLRVYPATTWIVAAAAAEISDHPLATNG